MPLADEARWVLDQVRKAAAPEYCDLTPAQARAAFEATAERLAPPRRELHRVEAAFAPAPHGPIALRIYTPREFASPAPVLLWLHGGGHVIGSLDSYDRLCRDLAARADCVIVAVDYRLAPEHKFPAAVEDAFSALQWVAAQASTRQWDGTRLAVGGDSAGGNLAAVCAILARDAGAPALRFQLLVYPATAPHADSDSHREFARDHLLTAAVIEWFQCHYRASEADREDYRYAPLLAPDLGGLPAGLVIVAECDPLRDEGIAYAERLRAAGNQVECDCYEGMIHPFFSMSGALKTAARAVDDAAAALRRALRTTPGVTVS